MYENPVIVVNNRTEALWIKQRMGKAIPDDTPVVIGAPTALDVRNRTVFGYLPIPLAEKADTVYFLVYTQKPPKGPDYTVKDMTLAGARLHGYKVQTIVSYNCDRHKDRREYRTCGRCNKEIFSELSVCDECWDIVKHNTRDADRWGSAGEVGRNTSYGER